jgi:hypothetical protein
MRQHFTFSNLIIICLRSVAPMSRPPLDYEQKAPPVQHSHPSFVFLIWPINLKQDIWYHQWEQRRMKESNTGCFYSRDLCSNHKGTYKESRTTQISRTSTDHSTISGTNYSVSQWQQQQPRVQKHNTHGRNENPRKENKIATRQTQCSFRLLRSRKQPRDI